MRTQDQDDRLLTAQQVAERLSVSPRMVWALAAEGRLRRVKLGPRCTRFPLSAVNELISQQQGGSR